MFVYKNVSIFARSVNGVTFAPGEIKEVPFEIRNPKFLKVSRPVKAEEPKDEPAATPEVPAGAPAEITTSAEEPHDEKPAHKAPRSRKGSKATKPAEEAVEPSEEPKGGEE